MRTTIKKTTKEPRVDVMTFELLLKHWLNNNIFVKIIFQWKFISTKDLHFFKAVSFSILIATNELKFLREIKPKSRKLVFEA